MKKRVINKLKPNVGGQTFGQINYNLYVRHFGPKLITPWLLSLISPEKPEPVNIKLIKNLLQEEEE